MKTKVWCIVTLLLFSGLLSSKSANSTEIMKSSVNDYWKWEKQFILKPNSKDWLLLSNKICHYIFIQTEPIKKISLQAFNKESINESISNTLPSCHLFNSEIVINLNGFKAGQIIISDMLGNILYSKSTETDELQFSVNVDTYPAGTYFAMLTDKFHQKFVFKMVKY